MQDDDLSIPILEEHVTIGTTDRVTGHVRVRTRTESVTELARADLQETEVEVKRVSIGRPVDTAPAVRTEGNTTIVPVLEEILVIEKRLVLKEELHITRHVSTHPVETPVTLRKQSASIERIDAENET